MTDNPVLALDQRERRELFAAAGQISGLRPSMMREVFCGALEERGWSLELDSTDPQTLLFAYPTVYGAEIGSGYVHPVVRIECGARSDRWPVAEGTVTPYVEEAFPEKFSDTATTLPVLGIERTFWEKASILHAEFHRPPQKPMPGRYSRHYADVAALAASEWCEEALRRDDLRARVVAHKLVFFPAVWAQTESAVPGTFRLVPPPERLADLARDYAAMREMYFQEPPTWPQIVECLSALEERINRPEKKEP